MTSPLDSALPDPGKPPQHHVDQVIDLLRANRDRIGAIVLGFTQLDMDTEKGLGHHVQDESGNDRSVIIRAKVPGIPVGFMANGPTIESLGRAVSRAMVWRESDGSPVGTPVRHHSHPGMIVLAKAASDAAHREPESPDHIPSEN